MNLFVLIKTEVKQTPFNDVDTEVLKTAQWDKEIMQFMDNAVQGYYFENVIQEGYEDSWTYEDYYNIDKTIWTIKIDDLGLFTEFRILKTSLDEILK